jgi:ECF sigma factor
MSEVTRILSAIDQGGTHASSQLLPLLDEELHQLAAAKLARRDRVRPCRPRLWCTRLICD